MKPSMPSMKPLIRHLGLSYNEMQAHYVLLGKYSLHTPPSIIDKNICRDEFLSQSDTKYSKLFRGFEMKLRTCVFVVFSLFESEFLQLLYANPFMQQGGAVAMTRCSTTSKPRINAKPREKHLSFTGRALQISPMALENRRTSAVLTNSTLTTNPMNNETCRRNGWF